MDGLKVEAGAVARPGFIRGQQPVCHVIHLSNLLQGFQDAQADPFVGLFLRAEVDPGLAGVVVFQWPAAVIILLPTDELHGIIQARVFAISQGDQALDNLQQVSDIEYRESKFPPVAAGFGRVARGPFGCNGVNAE